MPPLTAKLSELGQQRIRLLKERSFLVNDMLPKTLDTNKQGCMMAINDSKASVATCKAATVTAWSDADELTAFEACVLYYTKVQ